MRPLRPLLPATALVLVAFAAGIWWVTPSSSAVPPETVWVRVPVTPGQAFDPCVYAERGGEVVSGWELDGLVASDTTPDGLWRMSVLRRRDDRWRAILARLRLVESRPAEVLYDRADGADSGADGWVRLRRR